jgi:hypothetical protein
VLKAPGAFFRPLRAARRLRKNNGVRFRDGPGRFFPGTARNVRRNLFGLRDERRLVDVEESAVEKKRNRGMSGGSATKREGTKG